MARALVIVQFLCRKLWQSALGLNEVFPHTWTIIVYTKRHRIKNAQSYRDLQRTSTMVNDWSQTPSAIQWTNGRVPDCWQGSSGIIHTYLTHYNSVNNIAFNMLSFQGSTTSVFRRQSYFLNFIVRSLLVEYNQQLCKTFRLSCASGWPGCWRSACVARKRLGRNPRLPLFPGARWGYSQALNCVKL